MFFYIKNTDTNEFLDPTDYVIECDGTVLHAYERDHYGNAIRPENLKALTKEEFEKYDST